MINGLSKKEYYRQWRIKNPTKGALAQKKYRQKNPEKYKESYMIRHKNNKDKEKAYYIGRREKQQLIGRKYVLKKNYNLTIEQYDLLIQVQNDVCAICKQVDTRKLSVDHCHKTGRIRGLLCKKCNLALGNIGDNIKVAEAIIFYLRKFIDAKDEKTGNSN